MRFNEIGVRIAAARSALASLGSAASFAIVVVLGNPASVLAADGDLAAGQKAFGRCVSCHSEAPGENGIGPSLSGVFGRQSGSVPGFKYSPALQNAHVVWDDATLDKFLQNPVQFVRGSKMFVNVQNDNDRRNVIAYLRSLAQ